MLLEPSKRYVFLQRTTYTELVKPYDQYHMVVLDLLIIKPRVNIYMVTMDSLQGNLRRNPPITNFYMKLYDFWYGEYFSASENLPLT